MSKLKIVWLCHFTNAEVQSFLPLWKTKDEFASWIPNMLCGFENQQEIDLHVISPHEYLKKSTNFQLRNINYYFIPSGIPVFRRHWPGFFRYDVMSSFSSFRHKVRKLVTKINPPIVNLIGAENAYYSLSIFDFKENRRVIIGIQGFITQFKDKKKKSIELVKCIKTEERILKEFNYFYGEQDSSTYISEYNPNHKFFKLYFPVNEKLALNTPEQLQKYDCIYFGRLVKTKGAFDFIKVVAELKNNNPIIKACMVGGGDPTIFREFADQLHCINNIEFIGFVKTQKELFEYVKASKVFLVPPYKERLSSTIREAMYLKVPIVAYATGGIPYINEYGENIFMVETGDFKAMARKTLQLLNEENTRIKLVEKAFSYAVNEFNLDKNIERLISTYREILKK